MVNGAGAANACSSTLSTTVTVTDCILPIELLYFKGSEVDGNVLLEWMTSQEIDNESFAIMRSTDGYYWDELMTVPGAGDTNEETYYSAIDDAPPGGFVYYQLFQYDFSGAESRHRMIAIWLSSPRQGCESPLYLDYGGRVIDILDAPPGFYIKKCGDHITKIIKR
jgi:hypothetical protein